MIEIIARIVVDTLLRFFQQLVAVAELGCASGAGLGACRLLAFGYPFAAHAALAHSRNCFVPFILRYAKGTCRHAVAASHAAALVVGDRAERGFFQRANRTDRSTGRVVAVHAQTAHELVVLGEHDGVLVRRSDFLGCNAIVIRQAVFCGAALLTLLAADAQRRIADRKSTRLNSSYVKIS